MERRLGKHGIAIRYKYNGHTDRKQGVVFSKNGYSFSGSKVDRAFSYSKLDHLFTPARALRETSGPESLKGLRDALGGYLAAFQQSSFPVEECGSIPFGGGNLPLPPLDCGVSLSPEELQRRPDESPQEHAARITALFRKAAEAMLTVLAERKRREEEYYKPKKKLIM